MSTRVATANNFKSTIRDSHNIFPYDIERLKPAKFADDVPKELIKYYNLSQTSARPFRSDRSLYCDESMFIPVTHVLEPVRDWDQCSSTQEPLLADIEVSSFSQTTREYQQQLKFGRDKFCLDIVRDLECNDSITLIC